MLVNAVTKFHYVNGKKKPIDAFMLETLKLSKTLKSSRDDFNVLDNFSVLDNFNVSSIKTVNVIILIQLSSW